MKSLAFSKEDTQEITFAIISKGLHTPPETPVNLQQHQAILDLIKRGQFNPTEDGAQLKYLVEIIEHWLSGLMEANSETSKASVARCKIMLSELAKFKPNEP